MNAARYNYWRAALDGDYSGSDRAGAPFPGFYRLRFSKHAAWEPVAIFDHEGETVARMGREQRPIAPLSIWHMCCFHPVREDQYRHAVEHGDWWDSLYAATTESEPGKPVGDVARAAALGPLLPARR